MSQSSDRLSFSPISISDILFFFTELELDYLTDDIFCYLYVF
jgi:hypothetical protein